MASAFQQQVYTQRTMMIIVYVHIEVHGQRFIAEGWPRGQYPFRACPLTFDMHSILSAKSPSKCAFASPLDARRRGSFLRAREKEEATPDLHPGLLRPCLGLWLYLPSALRESPAAQLPFRKLQLHPLHHLHNEIFMAPRSLSSAIPSTIVALLLCFRTFLPADSPASIEQRLFCLDYGPGLRRDRCLSWNRL